jgi:hypothetical protein
MKSRCPEVAADFAKYEQLLAGPKLTEGPGIVVSEPKPSNIKWLVHKLPVEQLTLLGYRGELHTEVGLKQDGNFKFVLFSRQFMLAPLANYDSKGPAHRNEQHDVPLAEQQVTTPHFNKYNNRGERIAYKSDALRDPALIGQLEDITHCVFHIYDEFNIRHQPADYPSVTVQTNPRQHALFPEPIVDDPLAHVPRF